ncbi:MAG: DciA family protein, partial [Vicinamibacterales bacterium]
AWSVAVGPAMQRATTIRLDGARLLVKAVDPQWAREIRRSTSVILPRLQYLLGTGVVTHLEVGTAR